MRVQYFLENRKNLAVLSDLRDWMNFDHHEERVNLGQFVWTKLIDNNKKNDCYQLVTIYFTRNNYYCHGEYKKENKRYTVFL